MRRIVGSVPFSAAVLGVEVVVVAALLVPAGQWFAYVLSARTAHFFSFRALLITFAAAGTLLWFSPTSAKPRRVMPWHVASFAALVLVTYWMAGASPRSFPFPFLVGAIWLSLVVSTIQSSPLLGHRRVPEWIACLPFIAATALFAAGAGQITRGFFGPLKEGTLACVYAALDVIGARPVYVVPDYVGTQSYYIRIESACSGYEGMGLMLIFLGAYLFACRERLRFPRAFLLFAIGLPLVLVTNVVRLVAAILVGSHLSPRIADQGFHSQAGWLLFNAVGLVLAAWSSRSSYLSHPREEAGDDTSRALPYLAPLLVLILCSMGSGAFTGDFDYLYPIRIVATACALLALRRHYRPAWSPALAPILFGVATFVVWMGLDATLWHGHVTAMPRALARVSPGVRAAWIAMRVVGSVVVVPIVEELAFRGFLQRRLLAEDFESVSYRAMSVASLVVPSVVFGVLHGRWLVGGIAGVLFAVGARSRGRLADAVVAHAVANALIAGYVLGWGDWGPWL